MALGKKNRKKLPLDKTAKRISPNTGGVGLRRQIVMQYILAGEGGSVEALTRRMRAGVVIGSRRSRKDPTKEEQIIQRFQVSTKVVHKDIQTIRDRWAQDVKFRVAKEEYRAKLQDLFNRSYREAQGGLGTLNKVAALRMCRDLLKDMGQLDGYFKTGITVEEGAVLNMENKTLNVWLSDKENAIVPVDAEPVSD